MILIKKNIHSNHKGNNSTERLACVYFRLHRNTRVLPLGLSSEHLHVSQLRLLRRLLHLLRLWLRLSLRLLWNVCVA